MPEQSDKFKLDFYPLTIDRWNDFKKLFGERGACGGCWCMWWRLKQKVFEEQKGEKNRKAMMKIVKSGNRPGIMAYHGDEPIGWCSVAPREEYPRLEGSRILKSVDNKPVWSIVCLFVSKGYRHQGVSTLLIKAAAAYAKKRGGNIVEGYAVEPKKKNIPDAFAFPGLYSAYLKAGFMETARRSAGRPIMRFNIKHN